MMENDKKGVITITFGECVENHARMEMIGEQIDEGLSYSRLQKIKEKIEKKGAIICELINLASFLDEDCEEAGILIIRDGVSKLFNIDPDLMFKEHLNSYEWDKKALMYGRVCNKKARWNVCISDYEQEPTYEDGKGRVVNFTSLPLTLKIRESIPEYFGHKTKKLNAEGNYYYNLDKCYITFHGDSERKIVIAIRLGESMNLKYQWFQNSKPIGNCCELMLNHGDIYIMSEKATGNDWKKKKIPTLRHAAGSENFTKIKIKKEKL